MIPYIESLTQNSLSTIHPKASDCHRTIFPEPGGRHGIHYPSYMYNDEDRRAIN